MEDTSCKDVGTLEVKIKAQSDRHDSLVKTLTDSLARLEGMIKDLSEDMKAQGAEMKNQMTAITTQTNSQEVRLTLIESATTQQKGRIDSLEGTVSTHGIRLAQVACVAILVSLVLPVVFEQWITDRPLQTEIGKNINKN